LFGLLHTFLSLCPPPRIPTFFPYTTLFRSRQQHTHGQAAPQKAELGVRFAEHFAGDPRNAVDRDEPAGPDPRQLHRDLRHCADRSEEHTSELQSLTNPPCPLPLHKQTTTLH